MRARLADLHLKDSRGSAAVEFALVAGPLIFLICACVELALIFLVSVSLDNATDIASRNIRTGLTTQANTSVEQFKQKICDQMSWLGDGCTSNLQIDVRNYGTFAELTTAPPPIEDGKFVAANFVYLVGLGSRVQLVRVYYEWPLITPLLDGALSRLGNHNAVITAKAVFRNEPF
ncbi:TadE/TadG family type IV pilus assembly protein [Asticcacaulis sp.]|uniref:TadE/TadG family type IV pilus assembly protein n=1 Tax=Asticcacaulis sp. TaxID=1872648 RepID=UPI002C73DBBE|nr:TadE/TadG family type IV pilus assembly protein [Asticcacaulis sp.]HTM80584.1 TadE/TadG family type IV pilus assembly protein [Asticcacaulis sp.]